jgi:hypothetical protein
MVWACDAVVSKTPKIAAKMIREKRCGVFKRVEYPKDIRRRYGIIVKITIMIQ